VLVGALCVLDAVPLLDFDFVEVKILLLTVEDFDDDGLEV
jgi:hypothetical protein